MGEKNSTFVFFAFFWWRDSHSRNPCSERGGGVYFSRKIGRILDVYSRLFASFCFAKHFKYKIRRDNLLYLLQLIVECRAHMAEQGGF